MNVDQYKIYYLDLFRIGEKEIYFSKLEQDAWLWMAPLQLEYARTKLKVPGNVHFWQPCYSRNDFILRDGTLKILPILLGQSAETI